LVAACSKEAPAGEREAGAPIANAAEPAPLRLYLPDASPALPFADAAPIVREAVPSGRCPTGMVDVAGRFCIDRYEVVLRDRAGRRISPYYHPTRGQSERSYEAWRGRARPGEPDVVAPPEWQRREAFDVVAESLPGQVPNGYLSGDIAARACEAAGKRLCTADEWVFACRGQTSTPFPYGADYARGRCNVFRSTHPAAVLHGNPSLNHLDPRLNLVSDAEGALLRKTGQSAACASRWGSDAAYDLVGNLDEWVDDADGMFVGGFYARATRDGCAAAVTTHPRNYFDYSLGTRCCSGHRR
jgi:formylglycine-generating enzyme required for sulfatase activity